MIIVGMTSYLCGICFGVRKPVGSLLKSRVGQCGKNFKVLKSGRANVVRISNFGDKLMEGARKTEKQYNQWVGSAQ